jgi:hypothetical protein
MGIIGSDQSGEGGWSVGQGKYQGRPLVVRYRSTLPEDISRKDFPDLLAIRWDYPPAGGGMPAEETQRRMDELESLLEQALEGNSLLTAVVTGDGVREWQWYTRDVGEAMERINQALGELEPFPIALSRRADPDWTAYQQLVSRAGNGESGPAGG